MKTFDGVWKKVRLLTVGTATIAAIAMGSSVAFGQETDIDPVAAQAEMSFDVSKCQQWGPNLYRCSGENKPLCSPESSSFEVQCVRVEKRSVFLKMPGSGMP